EHVIGETLRRQTPERSPSDPAFVAALRARVADPAIRAPRDDASFIADPLSSWLESVFGVTAEPESGRLVRARPRSITGVDGAAEQLSRLLGVSEERCADAIKEALLAAYEVTPGPATDPARGSSTQAPFAFRLHQFISRGDVLYVSLEPEASRYVTMQGQQYKPGSRDHVLLPAVFCRECGQEYLSVRRTRTDDGATRFVPRDLGDQADDATGDTGFLYSSTDRPWPQDVEAQLDRLPSDWVETVNGVRRVIKARRTDVPSAVVVRPDGVEDEPGLLCHFVSAPFRFCLQCGVSYDVRQRSDFAKLSTLSSEGRSTATTVLSLSVVRNLRADASLPPHARKLLSFTDNRQDASLQAGHFNDFVEIGLLRGALYRAVRDAGAAGLTYDNLTQCVFDALDLPLGDYASDASVKFQARKETEQALRNVLGYRLYRDLKRGWRITSPNLEQVGLLDVRYLSLDEVCEDEETWAGSHPALAAASPETRMRVARTLLDFMRRELAIKVNYLQLDYQERLQQQSDQRLIAPWALDENEASKMEYAKVLFPRSRGADDDRSNVYLSARGGFGQYLRRSTAFDQLDRRLTLADAEQVIRDLLAGLQVAGLVQVVIPATREGDAPGYQLPASALLWMAGDATQPFRDPIRVPNPSDHSAEANAFFVDFYRTVAAQLRGLEAREHTAQVPYELREEREQEFRKGVLPILYCSPTMELGVDISELNVVNLRNVPPTPANYAQRSGRAGRSGQPALVFAYCTTGSPHDQYFFRHQDAMVAGSVTPPRLDLANEDLVRSHVHAIWLAETNLSLGRSLKDLLDLSGDPPSLTLLPDVRLSIERQAAITRARERAARVLESLGPDLYGADWYSEGWLDEVLAGAARQFDQTCERWRTLYRAAYKQWQVQNRVIGDASRPMSDKEQAKRLRREAESQLEL
ncbi:MAG TPA: helicase-related protein, partial [Ktedonobacterales bacterium]